MTEKIGCVQHDCDECKARLAQPTSGDYALGYAEGFNDACKRQPERTGWPAGLLQDDDRKLSKWLASKPDAKHVVDMAHQQLCKYGNDVRRCTSSPMNCQCCHDALTDMADEEEDLYRLAEKADNGGQP